MQGNYQFYTSQQKDGYQKSRLFMFEKEEKLEIEKNKEEQDLDNLVSFYDLLLKIDMRNNPQLYKNQQNYD